MLTRASRLNKGHFSHNAQEYWTFENSDGCFLCWTVCNVQHLVPLRGIKHHKQAQVTCRIKCGGPPHSQSLALRLHHTHWRDKVQKDGKRGPAAFMRPEKKNSQVSEGLRRLRWVKLVWHFQISDFEDGHQPVCGGPKNSNNHAISVRPSHQMLNLQYSSYKCLVFC